MSKGPIEQRTAEDDDIPVMSNFDNIAVDEISAEEVPEPRSAESLESAPEPGKYPYLQSKCYKFAFLQSRTSLSKVSVFFVILTQEVFTIFLTNIFTLRKPKKCKLQIAKQAKE